MEPYGYLCFKLLNINTFSKGNIQLPSLLHLMDFCCYHSVLKVFPQTRNEIHEFMICKNKFNWMNTCFTKYRIKVVWIHVTPSHVTVFSGVLDINSDQC